MFDYVATLVPQNSIVWDCAAGNGQTTLDRAARGMAEAREVLKV